MSRGVWLHGALRRAPVDITMADMAHPVCRWCQKPLPDDWSELRLYCNGACSKRASRARKQARQPSPGYRRKLNDAQRIEIVALRKQGLTYRALAARFGVNESTILHIVNREVVDTRS